MLFFPMINNVHLLKWNTQKILAKQKFSLDENFAALLSEVGELSVEHTKLIIGLIVDLYFLKMNILKLRTYLIRNHFMLNMSWHLHMHRVYMA